MPFSLDQPLIMTFASVTLETCSAVALSVHDRLRLGFSTSLELELILRPFGR